MPRVSKKKDESSEQPSSSKSSSRARRSASASPIQTRSTPLVKKDVSSSSAQIPRGNASTSQGQTSGGSGGRASTSGSQNHQSTPHVQCAHGTPQPGVGAVVTGQHADHTFAGSSSGGGGYQGGAANFTSSGANEPSIGQANQANFHHHTHHYHAGFEVPKTRTTTETFFCPPGWT